jgi:tripartite ATP-independent transporter DctP family solute receptor
MDRPASDLRGRASRRYFLQATAAAGAGALLLRTAGAQTSPKITLRLAQAGPPNNPNGAGALRFAEAVGEKTGGSVTVQVFHNRALGDERDTVEAVRLGTIDAAVASTGNLASFARKLDLMSLPFLFRDVEHNLRALDGPVGAALAAEIERTARAKVVSWWNFGMRNMWNKVRPINRPEDLVGLKMRVQQSPVQVATFNALGAQATPMSFGELYTSLQTGVVHGADNDVVDLLVEKFFEVTKYVSMTGHFVAAIVLTFSVSTWNKLTPEQQQAVVAAGKEAQIAARKAQAELTRGAIEQLKAKGLVFNEIPDKGPFVAKVQSVYEQFGGQIGKDLIEQARKA